VGKKVAFLVAPEGVEQVELTQPWEAVEKAGGTPVLVSLEAGKVQAFNHLTAADVFEADIAADDADVTNFVGLVLPGGVATRTVCAPMTARCRSPNRSSSLVSRWRSSATGRGRWSRPTC